jgi:hypothetical protein
MKKCAKKVLLFFGLDCGTLELFIHWRKRLRFEPMQTMIQTNTRLDSFLHEAAQNFELLSNIQDQK